VRLESSIVICRPLEEVGSFLGDISNVEKWDRGVGSTKAISGAPGVGFEFETLGRSDSPHAKPEKARMAYRITQNKTGRLHGRTYEFHGERPLLQYGTMAFPFRIRSRRDASNVLRRFRAATSLPLSRAGPVLEEERHSNGPQGSQANRRTGLNPRLGVKNSPVGTMVRN
jgi:hypothetical protein